MSSLDRLKRLNEEVIQCSKCPLHAEDFNNNSLFESHGYGKYVGQGTIESLMFVGTAPSHRRNTYANWPLAYPEFVQILKDIKLYDKSYFTNLVKCSFRDNVTEQKFLDVCFENHFLRELKIVKPKLIFSCGREVQSFLKEKKINSTYLIHPAFVINRKMMSLDEYKMKVYHTIRGQLELL